MGASFYSDILSRDVETWQRMLTAIETTLPTEPLKFGVIGTSEPRSLADPAAWCAQHVTGHQVAHVTSETDGGLVRLGSAYIPPDAVSSSQELLELSVDVPDAPEFIGALPALVRAFAPAAGVIWGRASATAVGAALASGIGRISSGPDFFRELPFAVAIPGCLDWVNWWSEASCHELGFSPDDPRASLFARVTAVPGHGVVLLLTDEPFDLDQPEHLAAVKAVYQAFPELDQKWGL